MWRMRAYKGNGAKRKGRILRAPRGGKVPCTACGVSPIPTCPLSQAASVPSSARMRHLPAGPPVRAGKSCHPAGTAAVPRSGGLRRAWQGLPSGRSWRPQGNRRRLQHSGQDHAPDCGRMQGRRRQTPAAICQGSGRVLKKHVPPCRTGTSSQSGDRGVPFRADEESHSLSLPGLAQPPYEDRSRWRDTGQRPQGAGGAGAGRGLWPPAGVGSAQRCGRGDGLCQRDRASRRTPLRAGTGNAPRFPARAGRSPVDRRVQTPQKASARPGGCKAPARGGSGAGRGLWPPTGSDPSAAPWQGRRPLPERPVIPENAPPAGNRKRSAFPRPRGTVPCRPAGSGTPQASARPGGCEAPARGGSGAGRGRVGRWPGALAPGRS